MVARLASRKSCLALIAYQADHSIQVYRFYVIYGSKFYLLIVPGTLYLAAIGK
jgi:hypothetical protein